MSHWLQALLSSATPYALAVNVPYAVAFALVGAEVAWLAWPPGSARAAVLRSAATATGMAMGAFVVGVLYTGVLRASWLQVATLRWEAAAVLWHHYPIIGAAATFVAWDFAGWIYHLVGHRTRVGWAAHQVHHSGEGYDATLGLRQSWAPFHGLVIYPLLAIVGFDLRVAFVCAAVSNCWQVLEHTSLPVRFPGWLEAHVMTPAAHRHHHGNDGGLVNMGPFFTWWDRLAGTWMPPGHPAPGAYGTTGSRASSNPITVELSGWVALVRSYGSFRRLNRNRATCSATTAGITVTNQRPSVPKRGGVEASQATPSAARMTPHQAVACREPPPARVASTNPRAVTVTITTNTTRTAMRATSSAPPSTLTDSATTSRQGLPTTRGAGGRRPLGGGSGPPRAGGGDRRPTSP